MSAAQLALFYNFRERHSIRARQIKSQEALNSPSWINERGSRATLFERRSLKLCFKLWKNQNQSTQSGALTVRWSIIQKSLNRMHTENDVQESHLKARKPIGEFILSASSFWKVKRKHNMCINLKQNCWVMHTEWKDSKCMSIVQFY